MKRALLLSTLAASAVALNCSAAGKAAFVYAPPPDFSKLREHQGLKGAGVFLLHIQRTTGLVTSVGIEKSTGSAFLDQLSLEAFRKWRAKPGTNPIVHVPINYGGRYPHG